MEHIQLGLVEEINRLHGELVGMARNSLEKAIRIGELLTQQKAKLKHGQWLPWIEGNLPFDRATAANYMRLFFGRDEIKCKSVLHLTDAYRLLSSTVDEEPELDRELSLDERRPIEAAPVADAAPTADAPEPEQPHVVSESVPTFNHRAQGTGENAWYTPAKYVEAARDVLGEIDLDPASSKFAQETIKAGLYYTKEENSLTREWFGRVWLNPPYSQPDIFNFCQKIVAEVEAGRVREAIMLTHNYTDTAWFHLAEARAACICFTRGRIRFISKQGEQAATPTQGQAFFYFGKNKQSFARRFKEYGFIR